MTQFATAQIDFESQSQRQQRLFAHFQTGHVGFRICTDQRCSSMPNHSEKLSINFSALQYMIVGNDDYPEGQPQTRNKRLVPDVPRGPRWLLVLLLRLRPSLSPKTVVKKTPETVSLQGLGTGTRRWSVGLAQRCDVEY